MIQSNSKAFSSFLSVGFVGLSKIFSKSYFEVVLISYLLFSFYHLNYIVLRRTSFFAGASILPSGKTFQNRNVSSPAPVTIV